MTDSPTSDARTRARRAADVARSVFEDATPTEVENCAESFVPPPACGRIACSGAVVLDASEAVFPRIPVDESDADAVRVLAAWRAMRAAPSAYHERRGEYGEVAIITSTDPEVRARALAETDGFGLVATRVVHPDAIVAETATISDGAVILAGAVIEDQARIGRAAFVGAGAVIESGAVVGDAAAIESRAVLSSSGRVGERALVGRGTIVCPNVFVGLAARVDYGEVVDLDVEPGAYVGRSTRRCS